jgi:two-component system response regulator AtoC
MRLLIVDDDAGLRQSLGLLLEEAGHEVLAKGDATEALGLALDDQPDVILCDVRMPNMDGLSFLQQYRAEHGNALVIMMSGYGNEDAALAAMREGAYDYLHKPFRPDEVVLTLRKAEEREHLRREVATLRATLGADVVRDDLVAESRAMRQLLELASKVSTHDTTVLLTGESGTGKEVFAQAIHRMSPRASRAFVAVNCAAIPEHLLESELFGHVKGAFTGAVGDRAGLVAEADEGTLLLDEIGEMPMALQSKLLRFLEEREIRRVGDQRSRSVDVRLIASTAVPLEEAVANKSFREDLYYRLNVVHIHLPPLRDRPEDVPSLLAHFAQLTAQRLSRPVSITPKALTMLTAYHWPGNVRELRNAVERAAVLSEDGRLDVSDFALLTDSMSSNGAGPGLSGSEMALKPQVEALERAAIRRGLAAAGGNRREAAKLLGVSLRTLFYKLRRYNLA